MLAAIGFGSVAVFQFAHPSTALRIWSATSALVFPLFGRTWFMWPAIAWLYPWMQFLPLVLDVSW